MVNDEPSLIISDSHDFYGKSFCSPYFLHFEEAIRVTPSLPRRGRQPKRKTPLTPSLHFSRLSREFLVNLQRTITFFIHASTGAEAKVAAVQKSVRTMFQ